MNFGNLFLLREVFRTFKRNSIYVYSSLGQYMTPVLVPPWDLWVDLIPVLRLVHSHPITPTIKNIFLCNYIIANHVSKPSFYYK